MPVTTTVTSTNLTPIVTCYNVSEIQECGDQQLEIFKAKNDETVNDIEDIQQQNHGDYTELCRKLDSLIQKGEDCLRDCVPVKQKTFETQTSKEIDPPTCCEDVDKKGPPICYQVQKEPPFTAKKGNDLVTIQEEGTVNNNFPEHLNKFIKRVEDIYKELDEIQSNVS